MREPLQGFKGDTYERPNQPWICGLSDEGAPCPIGPGRSGRCPGAKACHPMREGDRWVCNRSAARGGTCESGPSPEGECCLEYQCRPIRSLRSRRGRFVVGCLLATLGGLCLLLSASWRNDALAPGELTVHHAQLLQQNETTKKCASCHSAADQTFGQWIESVVHASRNQPSQSELCLECHQEQIAQANALWAHNIDPQLLLADADPGVRRHVDPSQELACSTCHREHHGALHNLSWMSDRSCQACHQQQYHSFATDHPDFENWPTRRRTRIAFDHGAHEIKHFPEENQKFDCAVCHVTDRDGAFQQTLGYEETCAKCHDKKIDASWEAGVAVLALPMLDVETLNDEEQSVGQWPEQAQGDFDGSLTPITKFLLIPDESAAAALAELGADFDFYDVDPQDPQQLQSSKEIIWATKRLLYELTINGHEAIRTRVEAVLNRKLTTQEFSDLTARLSPENLAVITERWLLNLPQELGESKSEPTKSNTPLPPASDREADRGRVSAGGWFSDETNLAIRYRPTGHADPWITAWLDLLAEATSGPHVEITKPLLKQAMAPTAAGQCGSCHSLDRLEDDRCVIQWFAKRVSDSPASFTKFSHGPHLTQKQLTDCKGCHQINSLAKVMESYANDSPEAFINGFQPLTKQSCAECHTPRAAGDSCLQCHKYHVGMEHLNPK